MGTIYARVALWAVWAATPAVALAFELPCRYEDTLSEAAADILLSGHGAEATQILAKVRSFGFDGVSVQAHEGPDEALLVQWMKQQSERADAPLVCGEARSESQRFVLVSARGGRLWREGSRLLGSLAPGFAKPHLVFEGRDGSPTRVEVTAAGLKSGIAIPEELGAKRVQLVAEGPSGPRPVSELPLEAADAPAVEAALPEPAGARTRPIDALLARIDAFRAGGGVGSLRPNALLGQSAQRHANRVCQLGRVGHRLDGGDDPETRLRTDRVSARAVGEVVSRAVSADGAMAAALASPSHRLALADKRFTDAGIGQALDDRGHTCVVVLLASFPRRLP